MGDMGEDWKAVKPYLKERRKQHVESMGNSALKNIEQLGLPFNHYVNNHQFTIETKISTIDYWGTTGTWIDRKTRKRGKGIKSLKHYLNRIGG